MLTLRLSTGSPQFGLSSAPTLFFFPAAEGEHAGKQTDPFNYDLSRKCVWHSSGF